MNGTAFTVALSVPLPAASARAATHQVGTLERQPALKAARPLTVGDWRRHAAGGF